MDNVPGLGSRYLVAWLGIVEAISLNPLAALFIILGVLVIIVGFMGTYDNVFKSLKKL